MQNVIQENTSKLLRILRLKENYGESVEWNEKEISDAMAITERGVDISNVELLERAFVISFCEPLAACLLSKGVDINAKMTQYRDHPSFLHLACAEARVEAVKFLVESGANINGEDEQGMRPISFIIWAIKSSDGTDTRNRAYELKKYLEELGAQETVESRRKMKSAMRELEGKEGDYKARLAKGSSQDAGSAPVSLEEYRRNRDSGRTP